jgi:hypothetical protein
MSCRHSACTDRKAVVGPGRGFENGIETMSRKSAKRDRPVDRVAYVTGGTRECPRPPGKLSVVVKEALVDQLIDFPHLRKFAAD